MDMGATTKRLAEASKKINEKSDDISEAIKEIDDALRDFNFGIPVWPEQHMCLARWIVTKKVAKPVDFREDEEETQSWEHWIDLGYDRLRDKWCLATVHRSEGLDKFGQLLGPHMREDLGTIPLSSNTRERKIEALEAIPYLIGAIAEKVEDAVEKMETFTEQKDDILKALRENK